jgi:LuxR family transcriptional regulator, maltose regulon positive regulatory protein
MARTGGLRASAPLIATKLALPRRRDDTLRRARLVDAIRQLVEHRLYMVVAPAGYGKTTLLVDFASDSDMPICWYTLGPSDAAPAVFLEYLVAAIGSRFPRFGNATRRVMAQANFRTDVMDVVAALVDEVQSRVSQPFAVVLDDYHEVNHNPAINQLLDALLKHAPEDFKLILASRTMPKLQLSRLAALRQAAGVGREDLRFTSDEVRELMRDAYQTVLPERVVDELTARSEGWIMGIILTSHTMWQGLFESMIRNSGQEQLYGYLAGQVFERQTPAVQRFLLASSILDDMEPAIAAAVSGSSRAGHILRQLEQRNLFVSEIETPRRTYRYHQLFRDFLRARLDTGAPGLSRPELEARAGRAYQQRGQQLQAVGHLLAASAFDHAAEAILAIAEAGLSRGWLDVLTGWTDRLPESAGGAKVRSAVRRIQATSETTRMPDSLRTSISASICAVGSPTAAASSRSLIRRS